MFLGRSHFHSGQKAPMPAWCLLEVEGGTLTSPRIRARHTLVPLLSTTMIETVKHVLGQSDRELVTECRQCGSNVDPGAESCPVCESTEIVQYDISQ